MDFKKELASVLNRFSQENGSDTPDFILAAFLDRCLSAWNHTVSEREGWYGRMPKSGGTGAAPMTTPTSPRHPTEISGAIKERIEMISKRNESAISDHGLADFDDAQQLETLVAELDESLSVLMLEASTKGTK